MTSTDGGLTFGGKVTLGDATGSRPALAALPMSGSTNLDVHLFWGGTDANHTMNAATFEGGVTTSFISKQLFYNDASVLGHATSVWRNVAFSSWTGLDGRLNVARFNPGEVKVYGRRF